MKHHFRHSFALRTSMLMAAAFAFYSQCSIAQSPVNVAINFIGASADAKALLDVSATDKGILIPRVALNSSNSNAPVWLGYSNQFNGL